MALRSGKLRWSGRGAELRAKGPSARCVYVCVLYKLGRGVLGEHALPALLALAATAGCCGCGPAAALLEDVAVLLLELEQLALLGLVLVRDLLDHLGDLDTVGHAAAMPLPHALACECVPARAALQKRVRHRAST